MQEEPRRVLADPQATEAEVDRAIQRRNDSPGAAALWRQIVQDPTYAPRRRARCLRELLKDRDTSPPPLRDFVQRIGVLPWLHENQVTTVGALRGEIPVTWTPRDTVFVLEPFRGLSVYLRVAGPVMKAPFLQLLRTGGSHRATERVPVLEWACS